MSLSYGIVVALDPASVVNGKEKRMAESQHPKGALLFMLIYLMTLTALWLNAYLRLWGVFP